MDLIEEIKRRLRKYPTVKYESSATLITVIPESDAGFNVALEIARDRHTVFFNGWHEDFRDPAEALECFAFGLSDECRLKESRRGTFPYRWTLEIKQDGQWVAESETGLLLFPFWKQRSDVYLQNNLISREPPVS